MAQEEHAHALEGRLVRLRAWEPADYPELVEMFNDPDVMEGLTAPWPSTAEEEREWIESGRKKGDLMFVVETLADRRPVGALSIGRVEAAPRTGTLGMFVGKPFWDRGYGTDALRVACRFAFRQANLQRIELNVLTVNRRAIAAYEKVGFKVEGTRRRGEFARGTHQDAHLMGLLAEELVEEPEQ
ncbi:MAG: GNAT family N-acetyltransferase [Actinobacteria bacterium]|nr:GNAT family N-acetyltransferase [Actinomycetota bacterium]